MNRITTAEILEHSHQQQPLSITEPHMVSFVEGRDIGMSDTIIVLSDQHRLQIEQLASHAVKAFGAEEPTMVSRMHSIPTLLARVDCTVTRDGVGLFEVEERPAGIGVTDRVIKCALGSGVTGVLEAHFGQYVGSMPTVVRHQKSRPNDDSLVLTVVDIDNPPVEGPILARGEPEDFREHKALPALQSRSISTILTKGLKRYMLAMEEAKAKVAQSVDELSPETSFVLKPMQGSKARDVTIYLSPADRATHGRQGTVTFERARREFAVAQAGTLILQAFIPPIPTVLPDGSKGNTILRVFALVHPNGRCNVVGGTYVSRRELVVHGASNAICGAVIL